MGSPNKSSTGFDIADALRMLEDIFNALSTWDEHLRVPLNQRLLQYSFATVISEYLSPDLVLQTVERTVMTAPVYDIHTHLYAPAFGDLLLWGIDDLLVYHYLVAEGFQTLGSALRRLLAAG